MDERDSINNVQYRIMYFDTYNENKYVGVEYIKYDTITQDIITNCLPIQLFFVSIYHNRCTDCVNTGIYNTND